VPPVTALTAPPVAAWRFFETQVAAVTRLSPSFVRLTLTGPQLGAFADNGWDQRFKIVLADDHGSYDSLPRHPDWYATWRRLPADRQNPIRTYTARAVRPEAREIDVDLVLHGDVGPASRFAARAVIGDRLVVLGPNAEFRGVHGGVEFRPPPGHLGPTVLVGDATATPAVLSILAHLPAGAFGEAVLEVPAAADLCDVRSPTGVRVTWLVRQGSRSGLTAAVDKVLDRLGVGRGVASSRPLHEPRHDEALWEVPRRATPEGLYAWVAGESSLVKGLRRHLLHDRGVHHRSVAFMGYWRAGRPGG
jgi:NADPH-dependent ferric siderophore reductase